MRFFLSMTVNTKDFRSLLDSLKECIVPGFTLLIASSMWLPLQKDKKRKQKLVLASTFANLTKKKKRGDHREKCSTGEFCRNLKATTESVPKSYNGITFSQFSDSSTSTSSSTSYYQYQQLPDLGLFKTKYSRISQRARTIFFESNIYLLLTRAVKN